MAMAERPVPRWASYQNPHTNNCQDLGNSILLLLSLVIGINIGINMLWHKLRSYLRQLFHIVCEKEAKSSPPEKQSSPAVHLRCILDPVKMTVTPPPTRRHHRRHRSSVRRSHCPVAWAPDADDEEKTPPQQPPNCSHNRDGPPNWESFQSTTQEFWAPWAPEAPELPSQTIRFQQTLEGGPLKTEMQSELGLEAYVYPVNPPPPSPQTLSHRNSGGGAGAEAQQDFCQTETPASTAPPPILGPAVIPEIPRRGSSARIVYDAQDVRRRLRELTREVEALSHCYPMPCGPNTADGKDSNWVYQPLIER
ncbi:spermatid maturation protein 1 isoform X2 [Erinaceus europaeus]|uniref:Spermatid maturation protein 1 isoform X2 n=1 Tax=Erinaceus europaeus TaxID=9365 RepID=A0ABM3YGT6_ERIEU|nr:spermatid maturation protein 1 isoform X2 [Erinaceus europaeus]